MQCLERGNPLPSKKCQMWPLFQAEPPPALLAPLPPLLADSPLEAQLICHLAELHRGRLLAAPVALQHHVAQLLNPQACLLSCLLYWMSQPPRGIWRQHLSTSGVGRRQTMCQMWQPINVLMSCCMLCALRLVRIGCLIML